MKYLKKYLERIVLFLQINPYVAVFGVLAFGILGSFIIKLIYDFYSWVL